MSAEIWKPIFDWAAVVLIGFTFIAGAGALITGKILTDRQDEKLRKFSTDLTQPKLNWESSRNERLTACGEWRVLKGHDFSRAEYPWGLA
jgi:hypothetical protein